MMKWGLSFSRSALGGFFELGNIHQNLPDHIELLFHVNNKNT